MPEVDFSFQKYVEARRGAEEARAREGAAYAYAGDLKVLRAVQHARPITLAVEATVRLWRSVEKSRLLGTAVKVGPKQFPRIHELVERCSHTLHVAPPQVYISPVFALNAHTLGTSQDALIVLNSALVDHLTEAELLDVVGHECGHIQNDHVVYTTTLYYLTHAASLFVRWIVQPAILALRAWMRRAEITCDRSGLICTRNLDVSIRSLVKLALGSKKLYDAIDLDEYLKQLDEMKQSPGRFAEIEASHPYLPKRVAALRVFAQGAYYRGLMNEGGGGLAQEEVDARVAQLLSVVK
ncbi:MAG TPA: M48 family metallopeptidase [Polyangia bacterium]|nr:M48 family metallopeptidase [Polyangia bacterium]